MTLLSARFTVAATALCVLLSQAAMSDSPLSPAAKQWWQDVSVLADDGMEGRQTGSAGYLRAADYVVSRFRAEGMQPAGVDGFLQPVQFEQQVVDQHASRLELIGPGGETTSLRVGESSRIARVGRPCLRRSMRRWCSWDTVCTCRSREPMISRGSISRARSWWC